MENWILLYSLKANLPILMVSFDYIKKEVVINNKFYPSGDINKDFIELEKKVNDVVSRNSNLINSSSYCDKHFGHLHLHQSYLLVFQLFVFNLPSLDLL